MTVSELILKIDVILGLDIEARLDVSKQTAEQAMRQNACCKSLLACCNLVMGELYEQYALDCRSTVVQAADGVIDMGNLKMCKVLSLVDSSGRSVPFKHTYGGLLVKDACKCNLTYSRLPDPLDFESEIKFSDPRISERIFTYGVIAEYMRIIGDYTESASWTDKLACALSAAMSARSGARLPDRRWLY